MTDPKPTAHDRASGDTMHYMTQLDAVRAFAVTAVLLAHYTPVVRYGDFGVMGVQCFFVLSGFLITGILLRGREYIEAGEQSIPFTLRQFYVRRFLRIFPIYYITVFVAVIANIGNARGALPWHLTYTTNIYLAIKPEETILNHFWALSVQEQFYLVWPCLILLTPRKLLFPVIILTVILAPMYRLASGPLHLNSYGKNCQLISNTDSLGLGALLAFCRYRGGRYDLVRRVITWIGLWIGLPVLIMTIAVRVDRGLMKYFPITYSHIIFAPLFAWAIDRTATGVGGIRGRLLTLPPLLQIGKISYAIYLFHGPMMEAIPRFLSVCGIAFPDSTIPKFILLAGPTLAMAWVSWRRIEAPLNSLKRHFPYRKDRKTPNIG